MGILNDNKEGKNGNRLLYLLTKSGISDVSWQEEMIYALEVAPLAKPRIVPVACYTPFPSDLSASYFIRAKKSNPSIIGVEGLLIDHLTVLTI